MIIEIGIVAGEIWQHLDQNGSANVEELTKATGRPKHLILMSLGWLAREGHVHVDERSSKLEVTLIAKPTKS